MAPAWLTILVSIAVTFAWLAALAIGYATGDYTPFTVATPVMLVLAGYAFGVQIIKRQNGHHNG